VREENFSSQNVKLFITAISRRGSSGTGYTVGLSDGSSFFVSTAFFEENNLSVDLEIDEDLLELLEVESESIEALKKAGDLISRAEQSSHGLFLKLKKKDYSDSACKFAVDKVVASGLLNDERYAEFWISARLRSHPEGKSKLYAGLLSRGVASEKAKLALENCVSEEDLLCAVLSAGNKLLTKYEKTDQKLQNALYRRGFSSREIKYFLDNIDV